MPEDNTSQTLAPVNRKIDNLVDELLRELHGFSRRWAGATDNVIKRALADRGYSDLANAWETYVEEGQNG